MATEKRKKIFMIIGSVAALLIGYFMYEHIRYVNTDNAQIEAHWVMLAPNVGGYIVNVNVSEGQKVKAGDVLAEIDNRDYQAVSDAMKANLVSAAARKDEMEKNFKRTSELYGQGAISQQQRDTATSAFSDATAKYEVLQSQAAQADLNLQHTKIKAPFDGYIAKKSAEIGQLAAPGVPLIGFVSSTERWVTANFKETEIEDIHIGAKSYIAVDAISGQDFVGEVESISSATGATFSLLPPDNATGNFTKVVQRVPVKIRIDKLTDAQIQVLRNGLSAVVKVYR